MIHRTLPCLAALALAAAGCGFETTAKTPAPAAKTAGSVDGAPSATMPRQSAPVRPSPSASWGGGKAVAPGHSSIVVRTHARRRATVLGDRVVEVLGRAALADNDLFVVQIGPRLLILGGGVGSGLRILDRIDLPPGVAGRRYLAEWSKYVASGTKRLPLPTSSHRLTTPDRGRRLAPGAGRTPASSGKKPSHASRAPGRGQKTRAPRIARRKAAPSGEQVFRFNNGADPETLDPHLMTGVPEHTIALALYEGLTIHHPKTLAPLPGMAERWTISPDRMVYTFFLRPNARWSNGDPVTARDFHWSWRRALAPETAAEYAYQLWSVKNAEAFSKKQISDFSRVGLEVVDEFTFRVTLKAPTPYFLDLTSFETLMPVHRATVEKHGKDWTRAGNIVVNGPFTVLRYEPRRPLVLVKNRRYHAAARVHLERIEIWGIDEVNTAINKYYKGELDWVRSIPTPRIDELKKHPHYYRHPYLGTFYFRFNVTREPFDDVKVRKAFSMAIDREALVRETLKGGQAPTSSYVPPLHGWRGVPGVPFDPRRARALLAEAGYPGGRDFPAVEILYNTSESHKQVVEKLAQMWKRHLGVTVSMRNTEWKVYLDDQRKLRYQISRAGWIGDYGDPNTFMDMFLTGGGNNQTGWSSPRYDELIRKASFEIDQARRFAHFRAAEEILVQEEVPIIPLYFYTNQGLLRPRVKGFHPNIRDLHPFQFVYIRDE